MDKADGKPAAVWPSEISVNDQGRSLSIRFGEDETLTLSAALLRFESPSAEPRRGRLEDMRGVAIVGVEPVGNYAVQLTFNDGHKSGIYSWDLFHDLASAT
ncbi:MAG: gamma-butyrobetaine hydroxylase family protein [Methylovirgula sp.]